ncbi:MAG: lytic transglycosylase domain-containing protein [Verrucomicrobiae bacterium]|nr:lytic transglycosylase domain-containing protein [Verrucomicrobiae bacterium]
MKLCRIVVWHAGIVACLFLAEISHAQVIQTEMIDYSALVRAITAVESGGNPRAIGQAGERGLMQIKLETWREVTKKEFGTRVPFARAFEPELNQQVGLAYLEHLTGQLSQNRDKLKDTMLPILVAAYHCGPGSVESVGYSLQRLSPQVREYVDRVLNLHGLYSSESRLIAMATPLVTHGNVMGAITPN